VVEQSALQVSVDATLCFSPGISMIGTWGLHRIVLGQQGVGHAPDGPPLCCRCCDADVFKERLGLVLEREDEITCAVGGCNFLLRTITHEAFAFEAGAAQFVPCSCEYTRSLRPSRCLRLMSGLRNAIFSCFAHFRGGTFRIHVGALLACSVRSVRQISLMWHLFEGCWRNG
jgi:hypothetical protein